MKKRIIATLLTVALATTLVVGCGSKKEQQSSQSSVPQKSDVSSTGEKDSSSVSTEVEEPIEISYVGWNCGEIEDETFAELWLEEKLGGIDIQVLKVDLSNSEQKNLMRSTGQLPECGWWMGSLDDYKAELTRSIPEDMIRKYAPNYAAVLDRDGGWGANSIPGKEGEYTCLTGYSNMYSPSHVTYIVEWNYDWLKKGGFLPEGEVVELSEGYYITADPFTQSELLEIFEYFTYGDPDGNGVNDTYAMTATGASGHQGWNLLSSIFGVNDQDPMESEDGEVNRSWVTDEYKEFMKFAAFCYEKGYVDPEFATITNAQRLEKIKSGKIGAHPIVRGEVLNKNYISAQGSNVLYTPIVVNDQGVGGSRVYSPNAFTYQFGVREDVDDTKLAKILEMFDFMCLDEEAWFTLRYGIEGTHFEYSEVIDGVGYVPKRIEGITVGTNTGLNIFNNYWIPIESEMALYSKAKKAAFDFTDSEEFLQYKVCPTRYDATGTASNLSEVDGMYYSTVKQMADEYFFNVVCGVSDIDSTWDKYVKDLNAAGYSKMYEEMQKFPEFP